MIKDKLRDAVIFFEEYVLVTITFDMDIQDYFPEFLDSASKIRASQVLKQLTWTLFSDSFQSPACILFPSASILASCWYLALELCPAESAKYYDKIDRIFNVKLSDIKGIIKN
jgi:hypothetical protein